MARIQTKSACHTPQRIAVDSQFLCGSNLISLIFSEDREDEYLLKFGYRFRILEPTSIQLQDKIFQLLFHRKLPSLAHKKSQLSLGL